MHPIGIYIKGVLRGVLGIYIKGVLRGRTCSTFSVIGYRLTVPLRLQKQSARRAHVSPFRAVSGDLYSLSVFFARSRFGTEGTARHAHRRSPCSGRVPPRRRRERSGACNPKTISVTLCRVKARTSDRWRDPWVALCRVPFRATFHTSGKGTTTRLLRKRND